MHKYKIRYDFQPEIRPEGFTKEDAGDLGLTDALVFVSIIENEDGSSSQQEISLHGENRPLTDIGRFKVWTMMGLSIADKGNLKGWQKDFIDAFASTLREFFKEGKR